jgi:hypothetical protein
VNVGVDVVDGVQESVDAPDDEAVVSMMLVGLRLHVRPDEGDLVSVRVTVPVNPLAPDTVIVDVPLTPEKTETLVGLALTTKSCTVRVTLAVWLRVDPVPVTVTVYVPRTPVQERAEVPLEIAPRAMLVGERVQVRPVEGETVALSETVPVKPLEPETVIVEVPAEPEDAVTPVGFAPRLKS